LKINPNYVQAFFNRGNAYRHLKEYDNAISDYSAVLKINPNSYQVFFNRSIAYANIKEYDKAIADIEAVLRVNPNYPRAKELLEEIKKERVSN